MVHECPSNANVVVYVVVDDGDDDDASVEQQVFPLNQ